jgi:XTP/dITP diphosphohydrolase
MRLVLASRNPNKLRELRAALPESDIALLDASDEPAETGATFLENARIKALHGRAHAAPDEWVAGEDSGIEVAALGGRPGIESARWAIDPVARLLAELDGVDDRRARYVCELVALAPDGSEHRGRGTLEGAIALAPRGSEGFGYDPIFVPVGESATVAELGNDWKAEHSHRARAARQLTTVLGDRGSVAAMDAAQALAELLELSSQVERAVILGGDGAVLGSTSSDEHAAEALTRAAHDLVRVAGELHTSARDVSLAEVELAEGGLFVLREGGHTIAAVTGPNPTAGLVVYDLRTCLRDLDPPKPKRRRATAATDEAGEG